MKSIKIKKFKKLAIMLISVLTLFSILFTMNTSVLAATLNIATNVIHKTNIVNQTFGNESCSNIGGLSVTSSDSNKRMYVLKSSNEQNEAVLYFFSNYTAPSANYGIIELKNLVGHANGMAIDDNYIYITCWNSSGSNDGAKDDVVRISRNKIWSLYNSTTDLKKGVITKSTDGVTVFSAVSDSGSAWGKRIFAITKYQSNGQFIINNGVARVVNGTQVIDFTIATIKNGKFVVSTSASDVFSVDTDLSGTTGQDIGYSPNCGLFIPRWNESSKINNTIVWVKLNSLSGTNRTYTKSNSKYRHIIVNGNSSQYTKYEVESISFTADNEMYASLNVYPYTNSKDCVVNIQRATTTSGGNHKFLGTTIDL